MSDDDDRFYSYDGWDELLAASRVIDLEPGALLLRQGEASDAAFFLFEGSMSVFVETPYGAAPLAMLDAPRLLGEIGALAGLPRTATIRAQSAARLYAIERDRLVAFGRRSPALLLAAVEQLGRQMATVNEALGLYANALAALEERGFDEGVLADLDTPAPALAAFAAAFRRFAAEIAGKRRRQDEMASAAMIQHSFLPKDESVNSKRRDVRIASAMRPTREVGGDFYDFFALDESRLALVTGDVCGKGAPASLFAARVVTLLRTLGRDRREAGAVVARANELLCEENEAAMFATAFFGILDLRNGDLSYCNCGHIAPFQLTRDAEIIRLRRTGLPLGVDAALPIGVASARLAVGDKLILITDGVTEATNADNNQFGEERLLDCVVAVANGTPAAMLDALFSAVDAFAEGADQGDDIACLIFERAEP